MAAEILLLAVILLAVAGGIWMLADSARKKDRDTPFERTGYAMGSLVQQTVYPNTEEASQAAAAANTAIVSLENRISWRVEGSDVARINNAAGKSPVLIDQSAAQLLETALQAAKRSGGAYDPTILPLSLLWNFDGEEESFTPPERDLVENALPCVGFSALSVNTGAGTAYLERESAALDLGGIGKGAACDSALAAYAGYKGVQGAVVAVGGSIGVYGTRPDGEPWRIGVRDPSGEQSEALGVMTMDSGCVSTSGIYEKGREVDGVYYHHIVDARTGYPADTELVSVTVVHASGAVTDALATACVVLGREGALALLQEYGAQGILVDREQNVTVTSGLRDRFTLSNTRYHMAP